MGSLKGTVKNKAHPEGSIAETYIVNEILTFCSLYLDGVETRFSRPERYYDGDDGSSNKISIFSCRIRPFGSHVFSTLTREEYKVAHWYVLNNCDEL